VFLEYSRWRPAMRNDRFAPFIAIALVIFPVIAIVYSGGGFRHGPMDRRPIAKAQIARIREALEQFKSDTGRYPLNSEGLGALLSPPPGLSGWAGPYIDEPLQFDPWGNPYAYKASVGGVEVSSTGVRWWPPWSR
jgi:general secretion pathway protein G